MIIRHGSFWLRGEVGFGTSPNGTVDRIEFDGGRGNWLGIDCHAIAHHFCFNGTDIFATNAWIQGITDGPVWMDPYYGTDIDFGHMTMHGMYRTPGTTKDAFGSALLLHVGDLQGFKGGDEGHTFDVRRVGSDWLQSIPFNATDVSGFIVSIDEPGDYTISVGHYILDDEALCPRGSNEKVIHCGMGETFIPVLAKCGTGAKKGLTAGTKAAIAVPIIVVVIVAAAVVVYLLKKKGIDVIAKIRRQPGDDLVTEASIPAQYTGEAP
jgi:hypothetical protein